MRNLYLVGMPGAGKSELGKLLAAGLSRPFLDLDGEIVRQISMPITAYFARFGEEAFRVLEHAALREVSTQRGLVVSTGGGIVTRPENIPLLRETGHVLWVRRSVEQIIEALQDDSRPLLQGDPEGRLRALERERLALYAACAKETLENDRALSEVAQQWLAKGTQL